MAIFILFLLGAAFAHFIYDGILAPSIRCKLRNDLFDLRDQLRTAQISNQDPSATEAFDVVHAGINAYLNRLQGVTVSLRAKFYRLNKEDSGFRQEWHRRRRVVEDAKNQELERIKARANATIELAFLTNSAPLLAYLLPLALCLAQIFQLRRWSQALVAMKPSQTDRLIPRAPEPLAIAA